MLWASELIPYNPIIKTKQIKIIWRIFWPWIPCISCIFRHTTNRIWLWAGSLSYRENALHLRQKLYYYRRLKGYSSICKSQLQCELWFIKQNKQRDWLFHEGVLCTSKARISIALKYEGKQIRNRQTHLWLILRSFFALF